MSFGQITPSSRSGGEHSPPSIGTYKEFFQPYAVITGIALATTGLVLIGGGIAGIRQLSIFRATPKWVAYLMTGSGILFTVAGIAYPIRTARYAVRQKIYSTWKTPLQSAHVNSDRSMPHGCVYRDIAGQHWMNLWKNNVMITIPVVTKRGGLTGPEAYNSSSYPYIEADAGYEITTYHYWDFKERLKNYCVFNVLDKESRSKTSCCTSYDIFDRASKDLLKKASF